MLACRVFVWLSCTVLVACASPPQPGPQLLAPTEEQMKIRSFQTRTFDVSDHNRTMRAVIAALQDLGFIIERANEPLGLITAARFAEPDYYSIVGVTVTVRPKGKGKMEVRANAIFNNQPISDPEPYQNFFATVQRSLFLTRD